jgi:hypothetical protein
MNTKLNKTSAAAIAVVLAIAASAMFLIVRVTPLFITAYLFTLLGIGVMLGGNIFLLKKANTYPWGAALPQTAFNYLITQFIVSLVVSLLEQVVKLTLPTVWFIVIQVLILAAFAIRLIVLNAGRAEIERVDARVKAGTNNWRTMVLDLEALAAISPEIKPLQDVMKYSDPVAIPAIAEFDEKIRDGVAALKQSVTGGDAARVSELCAALTRQIKERNNRLKMLK